jgi:hypothetical protein
MFSIRAYTSVTETASAAGKLYLNSTTRASESWGKILLIVLKQCNSVLFAKSIFYSFYCDQTEEKCNIGFPMKNFNFYPEKC